MTRPTTKVGSVLNRRRLLSLGGTGLASLALGGCGLTDQDSALYVTARQVWPDNEDELDVDGIAKQLPYASMAISVDERPVALMVLGTARTHGLHWIAADGAVIATKGAFITRTVKLERNISAMRFLSGTDIYQPDQGRLAPMVRRQCDLTGPDQFNLVLTGRYQLIKEMRWTYGGAERDILHVGETLANHQTRETITNEYWLDRKSGFCWETVQTAAPGMPKIHLRVLKHYSG